MIDGIDGWIVFNFLAGVAALVINLRRFQPTNPRRWMRFAAAIIAGYIAVIYGLCITGYIHETDIRLYMRWMQGAVAVYLIAEARNG